MSTLKSQAQPSSALNHIVMAVIMLGLFLVGLLLGNAVFATQNQPNPAGAVQDKPSGGAVVNPPFQVRDFALSDQTGAPMSLSALRGRAVVLFFGYTHCPDVCPTTLADFTRVKKSLGAEAHRVTFVLVTVDSKRDTPAVLKEYLSHFDPGFIGLTGDETTLRSMAGEYGAYFDALASKQAANEREHHHAEGLNTSNYFVQHTSPAYLIDPKGFLHRVYFNGTAPEVITSGIQQILRHAD
jgi:protein SCO1/2